MIPVDITSVYLMFISLPTQFVGRLLMRTVIALSLDISQQVKFALGSMEAIRSKWLVLA
jgi:hypothetical protein